MALGISGIDFECLIERAACGDDAQVLVEHQEGLAHHGRNCIRKSAGALRIAKLFFEHGGLQVSRESRTYAEKDAGRSYNRGPLDPGLDLTQGCPATMPGGEGGGTGRGCWGSSYGAFSISCPTGSVQN